MNYIFNISLLILICIGPTLSQPSTSIPVMAKTGATGNDVDDCAIWIHPIDPAKSVVIVNDKGPETEPSGLYVYSLDGVQLQKVPVHQPQNPDLRYNVVFGKDTMDVLVCADREAGNTTYNKIRVFKINPAKAQATNGFLTEITTGAGIPTGQSEAYGHSLYQRPADGALFSIVSPNGKDDFTQIKLESDGAGKVKGTIVRTWGGSDIKGDICEGICCDDELGFIYICDENTRVLKYYADPDLKKNTPAGAFALNDGISGDREGINIYRCADNTGYILVSSQGNDQIKVYDRISNAFKGTLLPEGMRDCDGLDVTAMPLGAQFPHGMAAFHLGSSAGSQFGFYDWTDIANGLDLAPPCDAPRPHGPIGIAVRAPKNISLPDLQLVPDFLYLNNTAMLRFPSAVKGIVKVTMYDLHGKLVGMLYNGAMPNNEIALPLNNGAVRPGAYLVKCSANNVAIVEKRVTVM